MKKTIRVFISQPMKGRPEEEIKKERDAIKEYTEHLYAHDKAVKLTFIDSFFKDVMSPLEALGNSLVKLSLADIAVFAYGWKNARGCKIEHDCCLKYGITVLELSKGDVDEYRF